MKHKKSQITMLMILGLAIFIAVGFILYVSKSAVKKQSQQATKKIEDTAIEMQPIKEFVQKCLDKLGKDGIMLLGKQGGYIYRSQSGKYPDYLATDEGKFFIKHNDGRVENIVSYNIVPLKFDIPPRYFAKPYLYPWEIFPYDPSNDEENFNGVFGLNEMPPLEPSDGIYSLQSQIENFIDSNMDTCADFSIFEEQGLEIVMEPTKTSVIIGTNDVNIKSKIPITITNPTTGEFVYIEDFSTNIDVRLKMIYSFVHELIENDIRNIRFDIDAPQNDRNSLRVELIKSAFIDQYSDDDVVIVTDERSFVYGKPFQYIFARKNRAPALYYIKKNQLDVSEDEIKSQEDLLTLLEIQKFEAEDPDEDSDTITFNIYEGKFSTSPATFPIELVISPLELKIEVTDSKLRDYQIITVNKI